MVFENFISYRRSETKEIVDRISETLNRMGYSTFCDIKSINSGRFDETIKEAIKNCYNFILVINQKSLERCNEVDDWVTKEIEMAYLYKKNIICIHIDDIYYKENLPESIAQLKYENAIPYDRYYYDGFIETLISRFLINDVEFVLSNPERDFVVKNGTLIKYVGHANVVSIPEGVDTIACKAFKDCTNIKKIIIPDTVLIIEESAFERCIKIESISIPASVRRIGEKAFSRCYNLVSIIMLDGLERIDKEAFSYCARLKWIKIPKTVVEVEASAFNSCYKLTRIYVDENNETLISDENGILYSKQENKIIRCPENYSNNTVTLPVGIKEIGQYAFYNCREIENIILPYTLEKISGFAFANLCKVSTLLIPKSVEHFDTSAITGWKKSQKVSFEKNCNYVIEYEVNEYKKHSYLEYQDEKKEYEFVLVKTTFESVEEAKAMAKLLLDYNVIVSGQVYDLHSYYLWESDVCIEKEIELSCIALGQNVSIVKNLITNNHSYELCQIIVVPIVDTTEEFAEWMRKDRR